MPNLQHVSQSGRSPLPARKSHRGRSRPARVRGWGPSVSSSSICRTAFPVQLIVPGVARTPSALLRRLEVAEERRHLFGLSSGICMARRGLTGPPNWQTENLAPEGRQHSPKFALCGRYVEFGKG
jgi:hypothetical protein